MSKAKTKPKAPAKITLSNGKLDLRFFGAGAPITEHVRYVQTTYPEKSAREVLEHIYNAKQDFWRPAKQWLSKLPQVDGDYKFNVVAPSKKRGADDGLNGPPAKKVRNEGPNVSHHVAFLTKEQSFGSILATLQSMRAPMEHKNLHNRANQKKYIELATIVPQLRSHFNESNDSRILLAIALRGRGHSDCARKALRWTMGIKESMTYEAEARTQLQHLLPALELENAHRDGNTKKLHPPPDTVSTSNNGIDQSHPLYLQDPNESDSPSVGSVQDSNSDTDSDDGSDADRATGTDDSPPSVGELQEVVEDGEIVSQDEPEVGTRLWQLSPGDQMLQARYFGIYDSNALVCCRYCGLKGHVADTETCPAMSCSNCNTRQHAQSDCQKQRKCSRCRRRGHIASDCTHPSVVAGGFTDACDLCGRFGHAEEECSYLWHAYRPVSGSVRQIPRSEMRIFCYNCGNEGHWGGDCSRIELRGIPSSFTAANAEIYMIRTPMSNGSAGDTVGEAIHVHDSNEEHSVGGTMPAWQLNQLSDYA